MCSDGHQPSAPYGHFCIQVGMLVLKVLALLEGSLISLMLSQSSGFSLATTATTTTLLIVLPL